MAKLYLFAHRLDVGPTSFPTSYQYSFEFPISADNLIIYLPDLFSERLLFFFLGSENKKLINLVTGSVKRNGSVRSWFYVIGNAVHAH